MRRLDHFALDEIEVQVLDPIIAALEEHLAGRSVGKYFLEDHALERLLAVLFELSTKFWQALITLDMGLLFRLLFLLLLTQNHIIIAEHGAQTGLLAHEPQSREIVLLRIADSISLCLAALNLEKTTRHYLPFNY